MRFPLILVLALLAAGCGRTDDVAVAAPASPAPASAAPAAPKPDPIVKGVPHGGQITQVAMTEAGDAALTFDTVGGVRLKNPLIAAAAEHLIDADGVRRALAAGVGAVVVKSTNESQAARDQLQRAEYMVLDAQWRPVPWGPQAPPSATVACRSGLAPAAAVEMLLAREPRQERG